jgi:glycerol-3-phosphate dehydrogenase
MGTEQALAVSASNDTVYDLVVIGGGVVGLAILRAATLEGWKCALVEQEPDLLSWASGSNSGIACTGVDASPGTLERALIRDSASQIRIFCRDMNIPNRPCGSLVCQWPWDPEDRLEEVLKESHDAGDSHATILSPDQLQSLEPNLNTSAVGAVRIPGEVVLDPWLYSIALGVHARENGAHIFTNFGMDPEASSFDGDLWSVVRKTNNIDDSSTPSKIRARAVVSATGLWSDLMQQKIHSSSTWNARPRRGQYRIFSSTDSTRITHPIQPVPTQRTKGIFVFSSLYDQVVVGPTALDQESRTDREVSIGVADELAEVGVRIIPGLDIDKAHIGEYVGIRPGTDKRDYQIHLDYTKRWIAAAGIRSTGTCNITNCIDVNIASS